MISKEKGNNLSLIGCRIWGEYACFTRPEFKVERVTYPIITPTAARGFLESIFWHPQFEWEIEKIEILKPIDFFTLTRNEINTKISAANIENSATGEYRYNVQNDRTQRSTLALKNVAYNIWAKPIVKKEFNENAAKYRDQFRRRIQKGKCFRQPYLGCKEFPGWFSKIDESDQIENITQSVGMTILNIDHSCEPAKASFFEGQIKNGVMKCPPVFEEKI